MKAAVVAMPVRHGACEENMNYMERCIARAKEEGAKLIVFPQNAVSGYPLGDIWLNRDFCRYADSFNERIAALADTIAIVWGNVRFRGNRCFNTAFFAYQQQLELKVCAPRGSLQNDIRYFSTLENGELIEYEGELIALNFHDELTLATLNITLDFSEFGIRPRSAAQIYVNASALLQKKNGVALSDGRCFVTDGKRLLQFSEYQDGYHICDLRGTKPCEAKPASFERRLRLLLERMRQEWGELALSTLHEEAFAIARKLDMPALLTGIVSDVLVFGTHNWHAPNEKPLPSVLAGFTLKELRAAGIYENADAIPKPWLLYECYEQTHSLRGVCYHAMKGDLQAHWIREALRTPEGFIKALLEWMEPYFMQDAQTRMFVSFYEREQAALLQFVKENGSFCS